MSSTSEFRRAPSNPLAPARGTPAPPTLAPLHPPQGPPQDTPLPCNPNTQARIAHTLRTLFPYARPHGCIGHGDRICGGGVLGSAQPAPPSRSDAPPAPAPSTTLPTPAYRKLQPPPRCHARHARAASCIEVLQRGWRDMLRLQEEGLYPAAFAAIHSPVLMLCGAQDPHPGPMIRASLAPHIPRIEYHEIQNCGHYPWRERGARDPFFEKTRDWLSRHTAEDG